MTYNKNNFKKPIKWWNQWKPKRIWLCKLFHKTSQGFGEDADFVACLKYGQAKGNSDLWGISLQRTGTISEKAWFLGFFRSGVTNHQDMSHYWALSHWELGRGSGGQAWPHLHKQQASACAHAPFSQAAGLFLSSLPITSPQSQKGLFIYFYLLFWGTLL